MGKRRKKRPEFELPAILIAVVQDYFGQRQVNKLTSLQANAIARICHEAAGGIGKIVEDKHGVNDGPHIFERGPDLIARD